MTTAIPIGTLEGRVLTFKAPFIDEPAESKVAFSELSGLKIDRMFANGSLATNSISIRSDLVGIAGSAIYK